MKQKFTTVYPLELFCRYWSLWFVDEHVSCTCSIIATVLNLLIHIILYYCSIISRLKNYNFNITDPILWWLFGMSTDSIILHTIT